MRDVLPVKPGRHSPGFLFLLGFDFALTGFGSNGRLYETR
jgi:hypothetical protein